LPLFLLATCSLEITETLASLEKSAFSGSTTYFKWKHLRIREDAYQAVKDYVRAINSAVELTEQISDNYAYICPAPGVVQEAKHVVEHRLQAASEMEARLHQLLGNVASARAELHFWGVVLTSDFEACHDTLNQALRNAATIMTGLNCQLYRFHVSEEGTASDVVREKNMLDQRLMQVRDIQAKRLVAGLKGMVDFSRLG